MTATDVRAWIIITLALTGTFFVSVHVATTGRDFTALAAAALITLALILAWARRRNLVTAARGRHPAARPFIASTGRTVRIIEPTAAEVAIEVLHDNTRCLLCSMPPVGEARQAALMAALAATNPTNTAHLRESLTALAEFLNTLDQPRKASA